MEDPRDPRYQRVLAHRTRFGQIVHLAAIALRQKSEGEDHIDAVISVSKAIDVFLLEYALPRGSFDALQRTYSASREYVSSVHILICTGIDSSIFKAVSSVATPEGEFSIGFLEKGPGLPFRPCLLGCSLPSTL